jgi:hypothetical protein
MMAEHFRTKRETNNINIHLIRIIWNSRDAILSLTRPSW